MTLRDYFAAHCPRKIDPRDSYATTARQHYQYADAMIEERERPGHTEKLKRKIGDCRREIMSALSTLRLDGEWTPRMAQVEVRLSELLEAL